MSGSIKKIFFKNPELDDGSKLLDESSRLIQLKSDY